MIAFSSYAWLAQVEQGEQAMETVKLLQQGHVRLKIGNDRHFNDLNRQIKVAIQAQKPYALALSAQI